MGTFSTVDDMTISKEQRPMEFQQSLSQDSFNKQQPIKPSVLTSSSFYRSNSINQD